MDLNTPTGPAAEKPVVTFQAVLVGAVLTAATVGLLSWNAWTSLDHYADVIDNQNQFEKQVAAIAQVDELMIMSVRLAASTGQRDWVQRYDAMVGQRDAAIAEAIRHVPGSFAQTILQTYGTAAGRLARERHALQLVAEGSRDAATDVVFSRDYEQQQNHYRREVAHGQMKLRELMNDIVSAARLRVYLVGAFTAVTFVAAVAAWIGALKMLNRRSAERRRAAVALRRAHDQLEQRVAERTANLADANRKLRAEQTERERIHQQLIESSRRLGMAQVATNVLHNVGNVLNSVNVAAGVIKQHVDQPATADLARVADLIREHERDLARFITEDERGRHLPRFLIELADQVKAENNAVAAEIETLSRNIDHIKAIVAMQQSHARVGESCEPVNIADVVRDALDVTAASLRRHGVEIVQNVDCETEIVGDRHKLLEILINLISNAKRAVGDAEHNNPRVTIRCGIVGEPRVLRLEIVDNGVGIEPDNLTRIFAHGFTTRDDGHGFGLHSCALAAQEMHGTLVAESDGPGRGATFRLELPIDQPEHVEAAA